MAHYSEVKALFADGEHTFTLGMKAFSEWEEKHDKSFMATFYQMVRQGVFYKPEVADIIRLALIGGGMNPLDALARTRAYVEERPVAESMELVVTIAEAAIYGTPEYQASEEGQRAQQERERNQERIRRSTPQAAGAPADA